MEVDCRSPVMVVWWCFPSPSKSVLICLSSCLCGSFERAFKGNLIAWRGFKVRSFVAFGTVKSKATQQNSETAHLNGKTDKIVQICCTSVYLAFCAFNCVEQNKMIWLSLELAMLMKSRVSTAALKQKKNIMLSWARWESTVISCVGTV